MTECAYDCGRVARVRMPFRNKKGDVVDVPLCWKHYEHIQERKQSASGEF